MKLRLILALSGNDFRSRFAGSFLGSVWAFIAPLITILVYWFVYTIALGGTSVAGVPYILWLISGILPWFFFSDGVIGATTCFWDYSFLVKKTRFRAEYLPLIRIFSNFFIHIVLLIGVWLVFSVCGVKPCAGQLWIIFWILGGFLLTLGIGRLLAIWCVYLRDVSYGTNAIIQLGFWLTPIFWNADNLPEAVNILCGLNPVAILVDGYRQSLLYGNAPNVQGNLIFWGAVLFLQLLGFILMKKLRPTLADKL